MSLNKEWFKDFSSNETGIVYMSNNHTCKVIGLRNITLKLHDGRICLLIGVKFVPSLKRNLISLGDLDELAFSYKASHGCLNVYKYENLILNAWLKEKWSVCSKWLLCEC